jgi:hypothetical protein
MKLSYREAGAKLLERHALLVLEDIAGQVSDEKAVNVVQTDVVERR